MIARSVFIRNIAGSVRYECALWKALWFCWRGGKHLMVGRGKGPNNSPYYCWNCFYQYPTNSALRNWLGRFWEAK